MGMIGNSLAQGLISGANIQDGTVDTPDIKDSAVTTAKLLDANVTSAKLATGAAVSNIGYTPVNKAGDTMSGDLAVSKTSGTATVRSASSSGSAVFTADGSANTYDIGLRIQVNTALKWLVGLPNNVADDNFSIFNANNSTDAFKINYADNATTVNGILGIGASPSNSVLHVKGDWVSGHSTVKVQPITSIAGGATVGYGIFDSDSTRLAYWYSNSTGTGIGTSSSARLWFETSGTERASIASDGKFTVGSSGGPTTGALNIKAGGASGVGWSTGLNIGDSTNYMGFIQDGGISRFRNHGTGGFQFFNSNGSALMQISNNGGVNLSTSIVDPNLAVPTGNSTFQAFLITGNSPAPTGADGCVIAWTWVSGSYASQIYVDIDPTNYYAVRTANSAGVWQSWRNL